MKHIKSLIALAAFALLACNNLEEIEQRVDDLENRVIALENQVYALNNNVNAIATLLNSNTINSVSESNGTFTITLSNGTALELLQGVVAETPIVSVDENGYWIVSYDGGQTYDQLLLNGSPVLATLASSTNVVTVTPIFQISADGYWQVSYDEGQTYEYVYNPSGAQVSAIGAASDLFQTITYDENTLTIILADGYEITVAIVPDFLCAIQGYDYAEAVAFNPLSSNDIFVAMKGVATALIYTPDGWSATLSEPENEVATLTVTAPSKIATKVSANSDRDLGILAISEKGYSTITKIMVYLTNEHITASPAVTVSASEVTSSSATFLITPTSDVTSFKYMLLEASETAPTKSDFDEAIEITSGFEAKEAYTLTLSGLNELTDYVLYVIGINVYEGDEDNEAETVISSVASAAVSTPETTYNSYYERYCAGKDIVIGEKTINKATYGDATLVTENISSALSTVVNFIDSDITYSNGTNESQVILIGNSFEKKAGVTFSGQLKTGATGNATDICLLYNLDIEYGSINNYFYTNNVTNAFEYVGFVNCDFASTSATNNTRLYYTSTLGRYVKNFYIDGCRWEIPYSSSAMYFINLNTAVTNTFESITLKNNIIYCASHMADFRLFGGTAASIGQLTIENNEFINIDCSTNGSILYNSIDNISVQNNLYYVPSQTTQTYIFKQASTAYVSGGTSVYNLGLNNTGNVVANNAYYRGSNTYTFAIFFGGFSKYDGYETYFTTAEDGTEATADPFAELDFTNKIFNLSSAYSDYGPAE